MILTNIFLIYQRAKSELEPISVEVKAHDPSWIKEQNMGSFLSVSHGSAENPVFLEMSYNNTGHLILPCHEKSNEFTSEFSWYLRPKIQTKLRMCLVYLGIYYLAFATNRFQICNARRT